MPVIPRLDGIFYDPVFAVRAIPAPDPPRRSGFINKIIIFTRYGILKAQRDVSTNFPRVLLQGRVVKIFDREAPRGWAIRLGN